MSPQPQVTSLICPLCQSHLTIQAKSWICINQHCFDIAKQGYVNLLPVQFKNSKNPGDTVDAVQARRAFLEQGFYQPLKQFLMQWICELQPKSILDIGCGEGYYTSGMTTVDRQVIGLDIAKNAIQIAAKRYPDIQWLVASAASLPVLAHSLEMVSSFFSPLPVEEMARVLKSQGHLIVATPAEGHLHELRAALFEQVNPHQPQKFIELLSSHFVLKQQYTLTYSIQLDQAALKHLIAMTPYAWKAKAARRQQLEANELFHTQASFQVYLFEKIKTPHDLLIREIENLKP